VASEIGGLNGDVNIKEVRVTSLNNNVRDIRRRSPGQNRPYAGQVAETILDVLACSAAGFPSANSSRLAPLQMVKRVGGVR
jgi:hypothetical protein